MKGIVQPVVTPRTPRLGPLGVLAATRADLTPLVTALELKGAPRKPLFMSEIYIRNDGVFLSGPFMGAPYAAMLLETLAAWGATQIIFIGWCGSISPEVHIGDILVPAMAWIDEGTSRGYPHDPSQRSRPSVLLTRRIRAAMKKAALPFHDGAVWTTDAIFRETPDKVQRFQNMGALAVEMEMSALFTVAAYLNIALTGILVVSDDLSSLAWKPGFKDERFLGHRRQLTDLIAGICETEIGYPGVSL
jgi:purine-nucleoside phosphorylase